MLRMVVLPAPFGPITEKTWPCATSRLTRVTAWTPPKAFETSRISSCALIWAAPPSEVSCEPPLAAAVVLDVAVALSLADPREAEIELLDVLVLADRLRVALQHDPPVLHHVAVLRDLERHRRVLLGEQHGDMLLAVQAEDDVEDLLHEHRRQAHRGLVEQHELRPRHERAPDRDHLLLAARDVARLGGAPLLEAREVTVDDLEIRLRRPAVAPRVGARQQILLDGEVLEDVPPFHHLDDAAPDHLGGVAPVDGLALELDPALGHLAALRAEEPRDGLERGGLAGPVGPEEGHDAPLGYPERDPLQHEDDVIVDHLDVADRQERPGPVRGAHPATSPSRSRAPCTRASCPPRSPPPRSSGGRPHAWARSSPRRGSTSCRPTAGRGSGRSPRGPRR